MDEKDIKVINAVSPRGALLLIVGKEQLLQVDPRLIIAKARSRDRLEATAAMLQAVMTARGVPRGVIIAAKNVALAWFGPVPDAWLDAGISVYHSPLPELEAGQDEFVKEYQRLRFAFANRIRPGRGGPGGGGIPAMRDDETEQGKHRHEQEERRHERREPGPVDPQDPRQVL